MKKIVVLMTTICLLAFNVIAYADIDTFLIDDGRIEISIPNDYSVLTRNMKENSEALEKYFFTKEYVEELFENKIVNFVMSLNCTMYFDNFITRVEGYLLCTESYAVNYFKLWDQILELLWEEL